MKSPLALLEFSMSAFSLIRLDRTKGKMVHRADSGLGASGGRSVTPARHTAQFGTGPADLL